MSKAIIAFSLALLCGYGAQARAVDLSVNGHPPLGAFGVETPEQVAELAKLGATLVFTYSSDRGQQQLDPASPLGKALAARGMKVMHDLAGRFTSVRLATELAREEETIAVVGDAGEGATSFPASGTLIIEGEHITYSGRTAAAFTGCRRGADGTRPARHSRGLLLCNSEGLKQDILAVKDSPNLWGFWLVDDARPFEGDSLKEMARVIRATDRKADGRPYHHVIVMGVGGASAMENFSPGICDALGVYLYPYVHGKLDQNTRRQLTYIMHLAKAQQPGLGLIGLPQMFREQQGPWDVMTTPDQAREECLAYLEQGAVGLLPYLYHLEGENGVPQGFDASPESCAALGQVYRELRGGTLKPGRPTFRKTEWNRVLLGADATPSRGLVLFDYTNATLMEALSKEHRAGRIVRQPHELDGRGYAVEMHVSRFDRADKSSDEWPWVMIEGKLLATTDWSKYRYLEQPLYNPMDHTVPLAADLAGGDGNAWGRAHIPVPPRTPVLLRLPLAEASIVTSVGQVRHWRLYFNAPAEDITLYLGNPILVPAK
jgi:hypothetical protein